MTLNAQGKFSLLEYDPLAVNAGDWIEGIVSLPPSSSTQFQMVTNDVRNCAIEQPHRTRPYLGRPGSRDPSQSATLYCRYKGPYCSTSLFSGSTATSVLLPGETVSVHVTAFTPASSTASAAANVDFVYLRFTRVTGTAASVAPPSVFTMQSLPPFFHVDRSAHRTTFDRLSNHLF